MPISITSVDQCFPTLNLVSTLQKNSSLASPTTYIVFKVRFVQISTNILLESLECPAVEDHFGHYQELSGITDFTIIRSDVIVPLPRILGQKCDTVDETLLCIGQ